MDEVDRDLFEGNFDVGKVIVGYVKVIYLYLIVYEFCKMLKECNI